MIYGFWTSKAIVAPCLINHCGDRFYRGVLFVGWWDQRSEEQFIFTTFIQYFEDRLPVCWKYKCHRLMFSALFLALWRYFPFFKSIVGSKLKIPSFSFTNAISRQFFVGWWSQLNHMICKIHAITKKSSKFSS